MCPLCKEAGWPDQHFLSACKYLPEQDRQYLTRGRLVGKMTDALEEEIEKWNTNVIEGYEDNQLTAIPSHTLRVQVRQSPYMDTFHNHHAVSITIDSSVTGNTMRQSTATRLACRVKGSSQSAHQADGSSPFKMVGETHVVFTRDERKFEFEGL